MNFKFNFFVCFSLFISLDCLDIPNKNSFDIHEPNSTMPPDIMLVDITTELSSTAEEHLAPQGLNLTNKKNQEDAILLQDTVLGTDSNITNKMNFHKNSTIVPRKGVKFFEKADQELSLIEDSLDTGNSSVKMNSTTEPPLTNLTLSNAVQNVSTNIAVNHTISLNEEHLDQAESTTIINSANRTESPEDKFEKFKNLNINHNKTGILSNDSISKNMEQSNFTSFSNSPTPFPKKIEEIPFPYTESNLSSVAVSKTSIPSTESSLGKPSTAFIDNDRVQNNNRNAAIIVAILIILTVCSVIGFIGYKRLHSYWNRRHYSRVDFLIDGLYEM